MFLIPLTQIESVDLVIHALRMAGGEADCTACPVRKVCTRQCLAVADGIQRLVETNSLPRTGCEPDEPPESPPRGPRDGSGGAHLKVVK